MYRYRLATGAFLHGCTGIGWRCTGTPTSALVSQHCLHFPKIEDLVKSNYRVLMSIQNTHDLFIFYYVFVPFLIVIRVVIALYLIFCFVRTISE